MKWKYGTPLLLGTENYVLQSVNPAAIPDEFVTWFSDPEVMRFMNDPMGMDKSKLASYFSTYNNKTRIAMTIYDRKIKSPIGIFKIYIEAPHNHCHTSVLIGDKSYWGTGAVLEIRERVISFLFKGMKLNKICGYVRGRNFPALFNYTKQKFTKEGVRKQHMRNHEGGLDDVVEFALLREEWLKRQEENSNEETARG
ncbi:GNAT family N-acetyltransferase [Sneathiella glossodoripedis]|uniref:GNAT family N-acetyltransferase n=1 Tax=Sneathiella glossodoripedis TaxID=418853 RepID=UPI00046E9395|nr:GNAT family protein [Sneathiella glossodoripedis]